MNNTFNEEYYKSNNYVDYLSKKERYVRTAEEIYTNFSKFSLIDKDTKILDYGCSLGFLIKGFESLGFTNVYGYDISSWAVEQAKKLNCKMLETPEGNYELGIFLDVLEHMTDDQITSLFQKIKLDKVLVRIPCSVESDPDNFYLEISRKDKTHINCKPASSWIKVFENLGYANHFRINMATIYDSDGCFCCLFV
jgi:SAM-dependent methyltransferase